MSKPFSHENGPNSSARMIIIIFRYESLARQNFFLLFLFKHFLDVHCDKIREKMMKMDFFFLFFFFWCKDNFESKVKIFLHFFTLIFTYLIKWHESETIIEKKFAAVDLFICEKFSAKINQIFVITWRVLLVLTL